MMQIIFWLILLPIAAGVAALELLSFGSSC